MKKETPKLIVQLDNPILRQLAKEVPLANINSPKIKKIIEEMKASLAETLNGVALAAPQIGYSLQVFIADQAQLPPNKESGDPKRNRGPYSVFINPVIIKRSKKISAVNEGCLSVNNVYGTVKRNDKVLVEAYDETGKKIRRGTSELLAQIVQHEIDHLNGITFVDKAEDVVRVIEEKNEQ